MNEQNMQCHLGDDELPVEVYFDYDPGQKEILNPIEDSQPGYESFVTINSIVVKQSIMKIADILICLNEDVIQAIEEECLGYMEFMDQ